MRVEGLVGPVVVAELENTNMAIGGSTGEQTPRLVRSPRYHVDGSSVEREIKDLGPCAAAGRGGRVLGLLAPDEDLAIV